MPVDYSLGKVYIIRSPNTEKVYIGSTIQTLSKRFSGHIASKNNTCSKIVIEHGDAYIELLENVPCQTKEQLLKREGELIRSTENCINRCKRVGQTRKEQHAEYYIEHTEDIKTRVKQYREENLEQIQAYDRQRSQLEHRKQARKEFRENNREKIAIQKNEAYQKNKEEINARRREDLSIKEKYKCECGVELSKGAKTRHEKRKQHLDYLTSINKI